MGNCTVCSLNINKVSIWGLDKNAPHQFEDLCNEAPLAPRSDDVLLLHFNGPKNAKEKMVRVYECWVKRRKNHERSSAAARTLLFE